MHNGRVDEPDPLQVLRRRLLDRLARRHERRITMVVAGAGFGKTTLVRQMLAGGAAQPSIDDVLVSIRSPAPDAAALVGLLAGAVGRTASPAVGTDRLLELIWARSPDHVVVVVDDVHLLDDPASQHLRELSERLPTNGHLVLVGRSAPFPVPQRALLDGSADVIDELDLAFDDDELSSFERLRGPVPAATGSAVTRWPALLELERASGRSGVVQYLVEELLDGK